jgi:hypothetical protein
MADPTESNAQWQNARIVPPLRVRPPCLARALPGVWHRQTKGQHVRRLLFNLSAIVSLALMAAVAMLWTRSFRVNEGYGRYGNPRAGSCCDIGVVSNRGILMFFRSNFADHPDGWENLDDPMICGAVMSTERADEPELWTKDVPFPQRLPRSMGVTYGLLSGGNGQFWDEVVVVPDGTARPALRDRMPPRAAPVLEITCRHGRHGPAGFSPRRPFPPVRSS